MAVGEGAELRGELAHLLGLARRAAAVHLLPHRLSVSNVAERRIARACSGKCVVAPTSTIAADDVERVVIDLTPSHIWDGSAVAAIDKVVLRFRKRGIRMEVAGLNAASSTLLERLATHDKPGTMDLASAHGRAPWRVRRGGRALDAVEARGEDFARALERGRAARARVGCCTANLRAEFGMMRDVVQQVRVRRRPHVARAMRPARGTASRVAVAAVAMAAMLAPRIAAACSLSPLFTVPVASPSTLAFLGRATGDTVRAGAGAVRAIDALGHFGGPPAYGAIHGQVVRVERLAPALPANVAAAVRGAGDRVVLVPWDYAADCRPVPWTRSARWLPDAARGLFQGTLRDRAHWVGDVPTLDVFAPQFVPYTGTRSDGRRAPGAPRAAGADLPMLAPDEVLALRATLPTPDAVERDPEAAYAPLRGWVAAHPTLAAREPARELVRWAESSVASHRFRRRPVPLAGTYRVSIRVGAGATPAERADSVTFYVRTEDRPSSPVGTYADGAGMYVLACAARTEAALPAARPPAGCGYASRGAAASLTEGYLAFGDSAWTDGSGRTARAGSVDVVHGDSAFRARLSRMERDRMRRGSDPLGDLLRVDPSRYLPGRFVEAADGTVSFVGTLETAGAPAIRIEAVRVSTTVMRSPDR